MKAVLDHVGIAVKDLDAALQFYRDALGLEVEAPEDVPSQQVQARFVPVGQSSDRGPGVSLELLLATAPGSPIARFIEKRGAGLHHITLRVDDIHAAVAKVRELGGSATDPVNYDSGWSADCVDDQGTTFNLSVPAAKYTQ